MLILVASLLCLAVPSETGQTGVSLRFQDVTVANNSYILTDHLGSDGNMALLCLTDKTDCCDSTSSPNRTVLGNWYSPDGDAVSSPDDYKGGSGMGTNESAITTMNSLFVSRGVSVVRLHRADIISRREQGQFFCEVPNADGVTERVNVILLDRQAVMITFSPSGNINKSVGSSFTLNCSVVFTANVLPQNIPFPTIEWSYSDTTRSTSTSSLPSDVTVADVIRIGDTYISSLQFSALLESHAGIYTCQVGGNKMLLNYTTISTIPIQVTITDGNGPPTVGEGYTLTCGISNVMVNVTTYTWSKDGTVLTGEEGESLIFHSLLLSSAGMYTCEVDVLTRTYSGSTTIHLNVPAPSSVVVSSNTPNPIRPVGTNVTLTCTVTLLEAVDIEVNVNIRWTGLDEQPIMSKDAVPFYIENNTYISNITIISFGNTQSGDYNCTARVNVANQEAMATNSSRITTGVYISHMGEVLLNGSLVPITDLEISSDQGTASESDETSALICYTDKPNCCQQNFEGEWYLPGGQPASMNKAFGVRREMDRAVQLTRADDQVTSPTGLFCCVILDADDVNQTACIHLIYLEIIGGDNPMLGNSYNLTCQVQGVEVSNYIWTQGDTTVNETGSTLSFSPLQLHHAGHYTCTTDHVEVYINRDLSLHIPAAGSVTLVSSLDQIIVGSEVRLVCTVEVNQTVHLSDLSLLTVEVQLFKDGEPLYLNNNRATAVSGRSFSYITELTPYERSDSGNYTCISTIASPSAFLITSQPTTSSNVKVSTGVYLSFGGFVITNNSNISVVTVGERENEALLCITDLQQCCNSSSGPAAEWYFPNGSIIDSLRTTGRDIYVSKGYGVLRLRLKKGTISPTGVYHCVIPDISGKNQTIFIQLNEIPQTPSTSSTMTISTLPSATGFSDAVVITATAVGVLLVILTSIIIVVLVIIMRLRKQGKKYHISNLEHFSSLSRERERSIEHLELKELKSSRKQNEDDNFIDQQLFVIEHEKAVPVTEFCSHVEQLHANRDNLFEMEYKSIPMEPLYSHSAAMLPENRAKNRFIDIFPYDISRVKLKEIHGEDGSDYINASYLDGYKKPMVYIAAQGPLPSTVTDFWRMIWESKLKTIVMLTRCQEKNRIKCEQYWPANINESIHLDQLFTVTLTSTLPFAEFTIRKLSLTCAAAFNSPPLEVTQFHFTGWPDHGVPQNGVVLINFIKRVRVAHPYSDPVPLLVHCSAGVGRTGTFIVLDSMLLRMQIEEDLNIYKFLNQLRNQRVLMVQTQAQYNFIHDVLNELILCGDTEILAPDLRRVINQLKDITDGQTGFCKQFAILDQMCPNEPDYSIARLECNVSKNRYPNILPNDHCRVTLHSSAVPGSDYINASFIDGYRQRNAYIATQTPMENTVNDFWRLIWEKESRTIVMLCKMVEDREELCCRYLPTVNKGTYEIFGKVMVKVVSQEISADLIIRYLELTEYNPRPQSVTSRSGSMTVILFHCMQWPKHGSPQAISALLELMNNINRVQMASGNRPITVMCRDGIGRTGTFICIHAQLERLKTEGVVDFFQSIKSARMQRAGLVSTVDHYILCHNVVADYIDGFDIYANFKDII